MPAAIKDAGNLASLYFEYSPSKKFEPFVASDAFEIVQLDQGRGRGMVASKDISAGECLFVIPPTVAVPVMKVLKEWKRRGGAIDDPGMLEAAADDLLLEEMQRIVEEESSTATANSFLVLEGNATTSISILPSIQCLLATDDTAARVDADTTTEGLRQIIRRNAFGPDFLTYPAILRNLPKRPHRVLGIFPLADMLNHSCQTNTVRVYVGEYMVVHASTKIAKGEEITTSYVPPTFCYPQRQAALQASHGFTCLCQRCQIECELWDSPTEEMNETWQMQQGISTGSNQDVISMVERLEKTTLSSIKSNELQRFIRLGFIPTYISYLNAALATKAISDEGFLKLCMQLHCSFISSNPFSTEHLSILHLAYEIISNIHAQPGNDASRSLAKVKFWTEQVKNACMIRYGNLGNDLDAVRTMMLHTRLVLRTPDGMQRASYPFI